MKTPEKKSKKPETAPICEEFNEEMNPFSDDDISGYSCDYCGWSIDNE
jgi:transposase-like protein